MDDRRRLMLFFAVVYAVEGIAQAKYGIVWQPLAHFLKEVRGWNPVEISVSLAALDVPWVIKPLYGLISDFLPLFGYRRRSWLVLSSLLASAAYVWTSIVPDPASLVPALVLTSVGLAATSTVCGALLVENGQRLNAARPFVAQQWLWFNIAGVVGALTGGGLIEILTAESALRAATAIAAVAMLAVVVSTRMVHEARAVIDRSGFVLGFTALVTALRSRDLWLIAIFLFCYYFSPGFGTPLYFELTDRLKFSQGFIGILSAVTSLGWISGALVYRYVLWRLSRRTLLLLSLCAGVASTLGYLGLSGPVTAVAIYFATGVANMLANLATLSLAAAHCPERAEGFAFAALMSVINFATPLADTIGATLYTHVFASHIGPLILVSAAFTGALLLLVPFVDTREARG
jgi:predicted MFS family arabinose efflux permease